MFSDKVIEIDSSQSENDNKVSLGEHTLCVDHHASTRSVVSCKGQGDLGQLIKILVNNLKRKCG